MIQALVCTHPEVRGELEELTGCGNRHHVEKRMAQAGNNRQAKTTFAIACDVARRVKELGFPGIYIISSFNRFDVIAGVIERMNGGK